MVYQYRDGESAAGKELTGSAVARVDHVRRLSDLVAKPAALAASCLQRFHRSPPVLNVQRRCHNRNMASSTG
jgi:hypothetical protein